MVAYSFKKQFIEPIQRGTKRQTIRAHRNRHARPGERIQIYTGMRTKLCRKIINDPVCKSVTDIEIEVGCDFFVVGTVKVDGEPLAAYALSNLARDDGFSSIDEMHAFWLANHGLGTFEGVIIKWEPS